MDTYIPTWRVNTAFGRRGWPKSQITATDVFFAERTNGTMQSSSFTEFEGTAYTSKVKVPGMSGSYPPYLSNVEHTRNNLYTYTVYYQQNNADKLYYPWFWTKNGAIVATALTLKSDGTPSSPGGANTPNKTVTTTYGDTTQYTVYTGPENDYEEGAINTSGGYVVDVATVINFDVSYRDAARYDSIFFNAGRTVLGMFGIPYQFMPHVDPRLDPDTVGTGSYVSEGMCDGTGREWAHFIASTMPILFISPGLPNFMTKFSKEERKNIFNVMGNIAAKITDGSEVDDLLKNSSKYYTFEYKVPEYYSYCNPACRIASGYMGVNDMSLDGVKLESVNWKNYTCGKLSSAFGSFFNVTDYAAIPFYIESDTQISESFSNDVTDSSLAGWVDGFSDLGREAMFLLGYGKSSLGIDWLSINADSLQMYDGIAGDLSDNNMVTNIIQSLTSVATGGRLIFPKIWSDSGFSRSYDVTIKLRSPDMDAKSLYLNIIVPYIHLWCLAVPRQAKGNPNGMFSPFLVRAIYKGFFNVDMGIISSMSVTKGDQAQWTPDGIPSAIDVNLTITDLYENITMSPSSGLAFDEDSMSNTNMMDYIANLCGCNLYQPEIKRTVNMMIVNRAINQAKDMFDIGVWGKIQNSMANAITSIWRP